MNLQQLCEQLQEDMENAADGICDILDGKDFNVAMAAMGSVMAALYNAHVEEHTNIDEALLTWVAVLLATTINRRHSCDH